VCDVFYKPAIYYFIIIRCLNSEFLKNIPGLTVRVTVLEDGKKLKKKRTIDNIKVTTNPLFNQEIVLVLPQHVNLADMSIIVDLCKVKISSYEVSASVKEFSCSVDTISYINISIT